MKHPLTHLKSRLLTSQGWDARVDASLIRAEDNWHSTKEFRSQGHTLRRLFEDLKLDAVLCVEGRPTVCVKDARQLSDEEIDQVRRKLWNLGATTLLLVEGQSEVRLFSTFIKPSQPGDNEAIGPQLSDETIASLEAAELALRLRQLIRRIETGSIYRDYKPLFDTAQAVDEVLLENLRAARNLICPEKSAQGYRRAHALIGRFLFSCYLLDRGIIGDAYLTRNGLPPAPDMLGVLSGQLVDRAGILEKLFEALQRDFNGSLFGDLRIKVTDSEVDILRRFLSGEDMKSGQMSFFKLYDFSFVPVELISSIYQEFLGAEADAEAKPTGRNQLRNDGQRRQGAYYTPPRLAELTVDIATEGWTTLLDKRCFDGACGSGIFLVILFVRMAEEWRSRNPGASTRRRYNELMRLLAENLSGVDVNLTACIVTCFSLYLAFLDQMQPKEITELREALERDARAKLLPRILWEKSEENRPRPPRLSTVREIDFFEVPADAEFDLVIGNPPWVSRKDEESRSAAKWIFSIKSNPAAEGIKKSETAQTLFPAKEVACGFMWKAALHVKPSGRVCQILPSRVFLSNNTDRFQAHWLTHHRLESAWLLADYSFILFPGADCPCFIGRYRPRSENEPFGEFEFITPKVELVDPREALIPVQPEDQKVLSEQDIVTAAEKTECALVWKRQHWGTPRDVRLVQRLMQMPKLSRITLRPPRDSNDKAERGRFHWYKGQGFQPATDSTEDPKDVFWEKSDLFLPAEVSFGDLVLLASDCQKIGNRFNGGLHRTRSPLIYKQPLLLINKACTKFLFSDFDVLFQDDFQSISAPKNEENELLFLTAILSSPLAQYLLFHTTANIGIERDIARLEEMLELPFPLPQDMRDSERSEKILSQCVELIRGLKSKLARPENLLRRDALVAQARKKLNTKVYAYFEISTWEQFLIEDTVEIFRRSSTPGSLDSPKLVTARFSEPEDRKEYAETLVSTFQSWTSSNANLWALTTVAPEAKLAVLTFGVGGRAREYSEVNAEQRVEDLLGRIRESSSDSQGSVFRRLRGFLFYEGNQAHLVKPLARRYWTRTAALNDADEILAHMMKEDGWGA